MGDRNMKQLEAIQHLMHQITIWINQLALFWFIGQITVLSRSLGPSSCKVVTALVLCFDAILQKIARPLADNTTVASSPVSLSSLQNKLACLQPLLIFLSGITIFVATRLRQVEEVTRGTRIYLWLRSLEKYV